MPMEAAVLQGQSSNMEAAGVGTTTDEAATLNSSFLEFLTDELVFGAESLDSATLEAVCQVANSQRQAPCRGGAAIKPDTLTAAQPSVPGATVSVSKRLIDDNTFSESDDEDENGKGEKVSGKRSKSGEMSTAATKKACREKARREKLNERFLDLARLVDPNSEPKTDKSTILTDAIKYVQQITVENHQLRQLNKFLEERVAALERERGQQLYQQSLIMSAMGQGQVVSAGQPMLVGGPAGMLPGSALTGVPLAHAQLAMPATAVGASGALLAAPGLAASNPSLANIHTQQQAVPGGMVAQAQGGMLTQVPGTMMAHPAGAMMTQMPMAGAAQAAMGTVSAAGGLTGAVTFNVGTGAGAGPSKPVLMNGMAGAMPYPGMYWLPAQMMDSTQDSLLRPPAA